MTLRELFAMNWLLLEVTCVYTEFLLSMLSILFCIVNLCRLNCPSWFRYLIKNESQTSASRNLCLLLVVFITRDGNYVHHTRSVLTITKHPCSVSAPKSCFPFHQQNISIWNSYYHSQVPANSYYKNLQLKQCHLLASTNDEIKKVSNTLEVAGTFQTAQLFMC